MAGGDAYVSGEVLGAAVVAAAPAHGDDLVLGAGLLQAHQSARHPRRHGPPVDLHRRHYWCVLSFVMNSVCASAYGFIQVIDLSYLLSSAVNYSNSGLGDGGGFPSSHQFVIRRGQSKAAYQANPRWRRCHLCRRHCLCSQRRCQRLQEREMDMMRVPGRAPASRSPLTDEVREVLVTLMGQFGHFTGFVIRILIHFLPTFSNFLQYFTNISISISSLL